MGIVVNTNSSSINVQRNLGTATTGLSKSLERLSTGYKINRAADDAAGLTISEGLTAQKRGADVAQSNAQNGINLLQTAEGDLAVIQDNLQRVRDLSVQAANGTYGTAERDAIKQEIDARVEEITRTAKVSKFNKINLLDGSKTGLTLQIGAEGGSSNSLTIGDGLKAATASALKLSNIDVSDATKASSFIATVDAAISQVSKQRSDIGALQNRLDSTIQSLSVRSENLASANSRIKDTDIAKEAASMTKSQILQQASSSLLSQANQTPNLALSLI